MIQTRMTDRERNLLESQFDRPVRRVVQRATMTYRCRDCGGRMPRDARRCEQCKDAMYSRMGT